MNYIILLALFPTKYFDTSQMRTFLYDRSFYLTLFERARIKTNTSINIILVYIGLPVKITIRAYASKLTAFTRQWTYKVRLRLQIFLLLIVDTRNSFVHFHLFHITVVLLLHSH